MTVELLDLRDRGPGPGMVGADYVLLWEETAREQIRQAMATANRRRQPLSFRGSFGEAGVRGFTAALAHPGRYAWTWRPPLCSLAPCLGKYEVMKFFGSGLLVTWIGRDNRPA